MDSHDSYGRSRRPDRASEGPAPRLSWRDERAALLAELQALRQASDAAALDRDRLLSSLAHELRGPLNSIFGWVQLLQAGRLGPEQQTRAFDAIARGVQAQTRLLERLRENYRASAAARAKSGAEPARTDEIGSAQAARPDRAPSLL